MGIDISVVIPNWNGMKFIGPCLDSLQRSSCDSFEVIVVDNGSSDGSQVHIHDDYPWVRLIPLVQNYGFARACNEGIAVADGELICLLNNDIEVHPDWLSEIKAGMERHPECGMGTSKMLFFDERDVIYNTGDMFHAMCTGGPRGFGQKDRGQYENEEYVFGACAGAGVYRRALFEHIGVFDEDFFIFSEDVDINLRAQYFGYQCIYLPRAKVFHMGTATVGFHSDWHVSLFSRNNLFVLIKNYGIRDFMRNLWGIFKARLHLLHTTARAGQGHIVFRSSFSFLRYIIPMLIKRYQLRRNVALSFQHCKEFIV